MTNILRAIDSLKRGRPIIIIDENTRENEGDLVASAQTITDATMHFMVTHSSGVICLSLMPSQIEKLGLPMIDSPIHKKDKFSTAFSYSIESSSGVGTGISAKDRAHTIRVASNLNATEKDVISPGHVFPLKAREKLLQERQGHTEASIEMCILAGLNKAAAIVELPNSMGGMLKGEELEFFAQTYDIPVVSIQEIINYKKLSKKQVQKYSQSKLPTEFGEFDITVFVDETNDELVVLSMGDLSKDYIPVRLHSKCLTGDVFHSLKCDCKQQLHDALNYIAKQNCGMMLYLNQEGRGISLADKIKTYALQEQGFDTIDANLKIGKPVDSRNYDYALAVLKEYNLKSIELISNNPDKIDAVKTLYSNVKVKNIPSMANKHNEKYLHTKLNRLKHNIIIKD
jgi:3,4-dihydroxy 2-butanone 4-phosphate synthase/GTP cyclohydrolase II